jgi:hypothetical protein
MPRPCACGAVANLDAVLGDTEEFDHGYDECNVCGQEWSTPNRAVWPPVIMHRCDLEEEHDGKHKCHCNWCEVA